MNVDIPSSQRPVHPRQAPATRHPAGGEGARVRTPAEVLAILEPGPDEPPAILIGSLWKTGLVPGGALS